MHDMPCFRIMDEVFALYRQVLASAHLPPVPSPVITARRRQAGSLNRTHAAEKITRIELGPYTHFGKASYFDDETRLPDGSTYRRRSSQRSEHG